MDGELFKSVFEINEEVCGSVDSPITSKLSVADQVNELFTLADNGTDTVSPLQITSGERADI